jgi:hypothetical protein
MRQADHEPLVWTHIREFGGGTWGNLSDNALRYLPMLGYAYRENGVIRALGGVIWFGKRAEGMFAMADDFRLQAHSRWVHRDAVEVLLLAHQAAPRIYARVDREIANARPWVERLGFRPDKGVWWVHGVGDGRIQDGGVVHSGARGDHYSGDVSGCGGPDGLRAGATG